MEQTPPYARIVAEIRRQIAAGELKPGDRVPSTRRIAADWGVAMVTAAKALTHLRQDGVVATVPRVGTVVATTQAPVRTTGITRDDVVRAGIAIADADGLRALSMRRVAAELGVPTMSTYRHVRGKEDLELLMADAVFADDPLPASPPDGWRARLAVLARKQWAICRRHPWMPHVISLTRPRPMPHLFEHVEWILSALDGHGLDANTMLWTHITVVNFVRGIGINLEPEREALQDTGITNVEWMDTEGDVDTQRILSAGFPTFARVAAESDFDMDLDVLFEFGLGRLLDGLAPLLEPVIPGEG